MTWRTASRNILKAAITVGALYLLSWTVNLSQIGLLLRGADAILIAVAGLLALMQFLIAVLRWQLLHRIFSLAIIPLSATTVAYGRAMLVGQFFPSTLGIDVARIAFAARFGGVSNAIRSVVADRILSLCSLLLIIILALPILASIFGEHFPIAPVALVSILTLIAWAALILRPSIFERLPVVGRVVGLVGRDTGLVLCTRNGRLAGILAIASHLLSALIFMLLFRSIDAQAPLFPAVFIVWPAMLFASLPISLNGWGVREMTVASAFAMVGINSAVGATVSILFGLSGPLMGLFGGCAALFTQIPRLTNSQASEVPK